MKKRFYLLSILPLLLSSCASEVSLAKAKQIASNYDRSKITATSGILTTIVYTLYGEGEHGKAFVEWQKNLGYHQGVTSTTRISDVQVCDYLVTASILEEYAYKNDNDIKFVVDNNALTLSRSYDVIDENNNRNAHYLTVKYDKLGLLKEVSEYIVVDFSPTDYYAFNYTYYTAWSY